MIDQLIIILSCLPIASMRIEQQIPKKKFEINIRMEDPGPRTSPGRSRSLHNHRQRMMGKLPSHLFLFFFIGDLYRVGAGWGFKPLSAR
jgi:hypothetical protein